jgi:hypothetical protein
MSGRYKRRSSGARLERYGEGSDVYQGSLKGSSLADDQFECTCRRKPGIQQSQYYVPPKAEHVPPEEYELYDYGSGRRMDSVRRWSPPRRRYSPPRSSRRFDRRY